MAKSKLAEIKTKPTTVGLDDFLSQIDDPQKKDDCKKIIGMMQKASGEKPVMWGSSIIGFGNLRYKSPATGREVDWFEIGFAPRKANLSIYLMNTAAHAEKLAVLGKHKVAGGCLYIKKLADVNEQILNEIIVDSIKRRRS